MSVQFPQFLLMEQKNPHTSTPWRFIEVYMTMDGPRTRVMYGVFKTREKAEEWLKLLKSNKARVE